MSLKRSRSPEHEDGALALHERAGPSYKGHLGEEGRKHTISDLFPYQEIFLRVLSYLSPQELAGVQSVNRYFARMSLDQQLWKRLYLSRYPHPHHSRLVYTDSERSSISTPNRSMRPIARLPSRAFPPPSPSRSPSLSGSATPRAVEQSSTPTTTRRLEGIGHATSFTQREARALTAEVGHGVRNDGVDWKMMLRLGTNWSNGNALSEADIPLPPSPSPSLVATELGTDGIAGADPSPPYTEHHIALFPSFIFTSNPASPLVNVYRSSSSPATSAAPIGIIPPPPGWSSPHRPDNVTAICADQAVAFAEDVTLEEDHIGMKPALPARLAVFYQSGGFVVLRVRHSSPSSKLDWVRESVQPPSHRPRSVRRRATVFTPLLGDPVVLASMHYPMLVTCTLGFHLSFYRIPTSSISGQPSRPNHLSTMHSDVSFHPAALSLFPQSEDDDDAVQAPDLKPNSAASHRACLTYCTPVYPASWTVALQEFVLDPGLSESVDVRRGDCWSVGQGVDADTADHVWPKRLRPVVGVKGRNAIGVGSDGRWCVLAGDDNRIQVYSLPTPSPSPSPPPRSSRTDSGTSHPPITHSQTLLAHSAAVTSVSLSAGRCVSGAQDGRVLVWELDDDLDTDSADVVHEKVGRTIGYVEVRPGGRRQTWRGASGPEPLRIGSSGEAGEDARNVLPHPASISSAARSLFLARPPMPSLPPLSEVRPAIRQLAFDEEKIVGLVAGQKEGQDVMKVWSFNL